MRPRPEAPTRANHELIASGFPLQVSTVPFRSIRRAWGQGTAATNFRFRWDVARWGTAEIFEDFPPIFRRILASFKQILAGTKISFRRSALGQGDKGDISAILRPRGQGTAELNEIVQ